MLCRNHKKLSSYFQSKRTDAFLCNGSELCLDHSQGGEIGWRVDAHSMVTAIRKSNDWSWLALIEV